MFWRCGFCGAAEPFPLASASAVDVHATMLKIKGWVDAHIDVHVEEALHEAFQSQGDTT